MDKDDIKLITEIDQRSKSNTKRLDEHDKKIEELSDVYIALTKVNDKVDIIDSDMKEVKSDLQEIKDKPAKRYETIITYIITTIIAAILGFLFAKLGMR
jgi:predicted transcriptional regulator